MSVSKTKVATETLGSSGYLMVLPAPQKPAPITSQEPHLAQRERGEPPKR